MHGVSRFLCRNLNTVNRRGLSNTIRGDRSSVELSYDVFHENTSSTKSPIIVSHGLFGSRRNWRQLSKQMNMLTGRKVLTVDAVNHGESSHHPHMSFIDMADDLIALIDRLEMETPLLVGHSMGGKTVMSAALLHPQRFERLVVVDIAPELSKSMGEIMNYLRAMADIDMTEITSRKMVENKLKSVVPSQGLLGFLLSNLAKSPEGRFFWRVNMAAIEENYHYIHSFPEWDEGVQYMKPTLFIGGGRSYYITEDEHPNIFKFFPAAEIVKIPDAGHWVHSEKPKEFLEAIGSFIS